jgi:hypothetical protein
MACPQATTVGRGTRRKGSREQRHTDPRPPAPIRCGREDVENPAHRLWDRARAGPTGVGGLIMECHEIGRAAGSSTPRKTRLVRGSLRRKCLRVCVFAS